jgi:adenosylcobinamide-phosphate synthase
MKLRHVNPGLGSGRSDENDCRCVGWFTRFDEFGVGCSDGFETEYRVAAGCVAFGLSVLETAPILLLVLLIDAVIGDPGWFYRRVPHPVVIIGTAIGWFDRGWNKLSFSDATRRGLGVTAIVILLLVSASVGWLIHFALREMPHPLVLEAMVASLFLAQNSLYRHVVAVERGFVGGRLGPAQAAVALIVGRDPASLDEAGTCRAAIESLAENFSDGIVAPVFWYLLFGLPGLLAYKTLNTADSMVGHRSDRYRAFGWASARLDDLANLIPARLTALVIAIAAIIQPGCSPGQAIIAAFRDARHHRSVNAGWPEAAMAGALDLRIAGPRRYEGTLVADAWMGDGRSAAAPDDIRRALSLYARACLIMTMAVVLIAIVQA